MTFSFPCGNLGTALASHCCPRRVGLKPRVTLAVRVLAAPGSSLQGSWCRGDEVRGYSSVGPALASARSCPLTGGLLRETQAGDAAALRVCKRLGAPGRWGRPHRAAEALRPARGAVRAACALVRSELRTERPAVLRCRLLRGEPECRRTRVSK